MIWRTMKVLVELRESIVDLERSEDSDDQLSVFSEPLGEEEELFTQEEDSSRVVTRPAKMVVNDDDDDEDGENDQSEGGETDESLFEEETGTSHSLEESMLLSQIEATNRNPIKQAKLIFKLGSFYQENAEFEKAVPLFYQIQRILRPFPSHEDISHVAVRCLSVCLRELGDSDKAVEVLNKDIDLLVYRKSRIAGESEYNDYYESELLRSYEELGNCYITYVLCFLLSHFIDCSIARKGSRCLRALRSVTIDRSARLATCIPPP